MTRKGYSDGPFGQIHWRICGKRGSRPDLYCLHPAPFSGRSFTAIMPLLAQDCRVIAPDYPGHGGSDPYREDATIADYARAMVALAEEISGDGAVNLLGFHTGCLVATEMALTDPDRIKCIALIDVPAFERETRAKLVGSAGAPPKLTTDMDCLATHWQRAVAKQAEAQGIERSLSMFAEPLHHGAAMNAAFHAGFSYDVESRLTQLTRPTMVMATQSALLEPSKRAAALIPEAHLVERLDITRSVLVEAANETASEVQRFLVRQHDPGGKERLCRCRG